MLLLLFCSGRGERFVLSHFNFGGKTQVWKWRALGGLGLAQRSQDQRLSFLGQLGGRTPDDPCQTPRGRKPFCCGVGCSGGLPSWEALATGARRAIREPDEFEPGGLRQGWQHEAASRVEQEFRDQVLFERLLAQDRAMILSQAGPGAGTAFSVVPTGFLTQIPLHLFRVVLLRRFRLPLPLSGGLHSRAPLLVSAEKRVVVGTNCMMRDLDLPVLATDSRRLEVVVDGLHLLGGANWQSTPSHMMVQRTGTAWFSKQPADVRSVVTNWWVLGVGPVWWCWQLKSEGAGLPKLIFGPICKGKILSRNTTPAEACRASLAVAGKYSRLCHSEGCCHFLARVEGCTRF